ncbi:MAG: hypothetical protein IK090_00970 [Clostridia bacterium]|nr:hypothetical protein [Clostridia bacterium]
METKRILSLFLVFSLLLSLPLLFAGCVADGKDGKTYRLIPVTGEEAVAPNKRSYSDEVQAILDEYYRKMLEEYPSWREIPRRMLQEHYDETDDRVNVSFTFCFGGFTTDCRCSFSSGPANPEGGWTIEENGFQKYYSAGASQKQINAILERLAMQIEAQIENNGLVAKESVRDNIHPVWRSRDGELYAEAEFIAYYANPPKNTDPDEFVSDHEHLFASIKLK